MIPFPPAGLGRLLTRLYEAWNKPDKRAEWQQKLDEFTQSTSASSALPDSASDS